MQRSPADLSLPKIPVTVQVLGPGGEPVLLRVFLAEHRDHEFHRQHVIEMLESDGHFMPAEDVNTGEWSLVNKHMLRYVGIPRIGGALPVEDGPETADEELFDVRVSVRVVLSRADAVTGDVLYSPPADHARLVDHLNAGHRFFRVWTDDMVYLINKAHVVRVIEQGEEG